MTLRLTTLAWAGLAMLLSGCALGGRAQVGRSSAPPVIVAPPPDDTCRKPVPVVPPPPVERVPVPQY